MSVAAVAPARKRAPASIAESSPQPDAFLLMRAAHDGDAVRIATMMKRGSELSTEASNSLLETGWTPLHEASRRGHYRVVQEFLRHGVPSNVLSDRFGRTPFLVAVENNREAVVQVLLERGGVNCLHQTVDFSGDTALHRACASYNLSMVQRLLDAGADIYRQNKVGETVLESIGDNELSWRYDLDLLLRNQRHSVILGVVEQAFLLDRGEKSFLVQLGEVQAAKGGSYPLLLPDVTSVSLISMLKRRDAQRRTIIEFIKEKFGLVEADAFFRICARSFLHRARLCPAQRLRSASSLGDLQEFHQARESLQKKLDATAEDVNQAAANEEGLTPLHCACLYGQDKIVAQLLDGGANLWAETSTGQTPLSLATRAEHLGVVEEILRRLLVR